MVSYLLERNKTRCVRKISIELYFSTLCDNESFVIEPFLQEMSRLVGVGGEEERQKLTDNKLFIKLVQPLGVKWGLSRAVELGLDRYVTYNLQYES